MINNKITVLVSTCDKYSFLWKDFGECFRSNWAINCEVIFVSESITNPEFKTIITGFKPWGERQLEALKHVKTDLVFWLLDDYFLCFKYKPEIFDIYIKDFHEMEMDRLQISPKSYVNSKHVYESENIIKLNLFDYESISSNYEYSVSMQPSIWRKEYMQCILEKDYSPWDFEIKGSKMNNSKKVYIDKSVTLNPYFNAVRNSNRITIKRIIDFIDKLILKIFYQNRTFRFSKGYNEFISKKKFINE